MTSHPTICRLVLLVGLLISPCVNAQAPKGEEGEQWAVLIAVKSHETESLNLAFTLADAQRLKQVLVERAGVASDHILDMTETADDKRKPTLANLRRELPKFLAKLRAKDRVLVFFSGHGMVEDGKTYLVPGDGRPDAMKTTGLPIGEVRDALTKCPAAVKFLILDCCHAGGARSPKKSEVPAEELAKALDVQETAGVVVLASCKAKESSWEWNERRQGLFSYWLCRGLEGGADTNGDGKISADEIYEYAHKRVSQTATQVFGRKQTPVRIIGSEVAGVPTVLTLRPEPPESLCRRLAEHLDLEIRTAKLGKVGVLEFLTPVGSGEGLAQANLPVYCAKHIQTALAELAGTSYAVLDEDNMKLAARGLRAKDIGDGNVMRALGQRGGGLNGLITGTLRRRGRNLHVQCDLINTEGNSLATPTGVLPLSEELLGDNGASFDNQQRPGGSPYAVTVLEHVNTQAQQGHPLLKDDFPFKVEIFSVLAKDGEEITENTPRKRKEFVTTFEENKNNKEVKRDLLIAAREGEIFEIHVHNKTKNAVAMALLVDGINSLGQKRERLSYAWSHILSPEKEKIVAGWYVPRKNGGEFDLRRFKFVDVAQSVAGRQHFGESIGVITAAFYAEHGRALGVGEGPEERRNLHTVNFQAGRLLGVVQIRYVDERELKK